MDEGALAAALAAKRLGYAYLDVFTSEPLPSESPLWKLPNVLISPHNAGASTGNDLRINALFLDNLQRWKTSQPLINEVKKP